MIIGAGWDIKSARESMEWVKCRVCPSSNPLETYECDGGAIVKSEM
jgi:hypothetical protein